MTREEFLNLAPAYYALAIAIVSRNNRGRAITERMVWVANRYEEDGDPDLHSYVEKDALIKAGFQWCVERGLLDVTPDPFGPNIYKQGENFRENFSQLVEERVSPFHNYEASGGGESWLQAALLKVNAEYDHLGLTDESFNSPEVEWSPIPIDQNNETFKNAIQSLEKTIEAVRTENGYAVTYPEEKQFIFDNLSQGAKTLKESNSTSWPYIKTVILDKLDIVIRRFGKASAGVVAKATKDYFVDYLKQNAPAAILAIVKMIFGG